MCQKGGPTLRRSSTYRSGHGTDLDTGKQRQFGPWESGGNWKQRTQRPPRISAVCRRWLGFSGEPCSEPDQAADDRARRLHYPCVAINSTSKGFHCCFFCLRWDTPAIPSFMHCLCFPTPLFVIAELVPMLELGMAEPVQIHAVEAGIFWLAASRNRSVTSNVPGLPWVLEGSKVFCGSVARVRMPTSLLPKPPAEAGPSKRVHLKQSDFDAHGLTLGCPGCRAMREYIRAQGHSPICRARMEELLRGTAKDQQRLEEAERRTRDTAGERAAKRIKLQFTDRRADPVSSCSASRSDATAGGDAASASNVVAGCVAQNAGNAVAVGAAPDAAQDTAMSGEDDRRRNHPT